MYPCCPSSSDESINCNVFNCTKKELVKSGFYRTKLFDNIVCCGCGWQSGDTQLSIRHLNFIHKLHNPDCELSKNCPGDFVSYSKYKKEIYNVEIIMGETFLTWPKCYPDVRKMVEAGFYFVGTGDATACVTCGVMLEHWKPDDNPLEEHRKASPLCELVR